MAENLLSLYAQTARGMGNPQNVFANRMADDEAMANYLAMQPQEPVRNGLDRDALLPWAYEVKDGVRSQTGQFAVPQIGVDVWNAIKSVGNAPLMAPYNPAERDSMIEHAGAVVGPMAGVGIARGAMAPAGRNELGVFGSVGNRVARSPERAAAVIDRAARMERYNPGWTLRGLFDRQIATPRRVDAEPFDLARVVENGRSIAEVPVNDIRTVQPRVSLAEVKNKLVDNSSDDGRPPSVFKWGDQYYVNDGNHRIVAARARGLGTIPAEVIELASKDAHPSLPAQMPRQADVAPQHLGSQAVDQSPKPITGSADAGQFDDALISIIRKYGLLPPAVAAGALAASNPDQAQARQ